ncbi:MAG TPA: bifunctional phosphopantothenoylcysteine decarboxylase/phosphopantothenate--cysteine ligase CoaBC [Opitutaceae bacterium]
MSHLLFILSGSIAAYKACDAISQLVQRGHRVRTVATEAALKFVGTATLEGLTRERVATDTFASGHALEHIDLARWADAVVVCPASADLLNRMAAGLAGDLASTLLLAHDWKKPLLIAPAMNPAMWQHPATRAAVARLRGWSARFIAPGAGRTACGEVGEGRLAEPDEIVEQVEAALIRPPRALRVLVTSGGTAEPIDGVRAIANSSTGATGALIAEELARQGHAVTLLRARTATHASGVREREYYAFAELDAALGELLGAEDFDAVVHAAAVSDFAVDTVEIDGVAHPPGETKLGSGLAPVLRLRRNPKLLDALRTRSRHPAILVVGFKLTRGASPAEVEAAVQALTHGGAVDLVVHNDLTQAARGGAFPAELWSGEGRRLERCAGRAELARALARRLAEDCAGARSAPASA